MTGSSIPGWRTNHNFAFVIDSARLHQKSPKLQSWPQSLALMDVRLSLLLLASHWARSSNPLPSTSALLNYRPIATPIMQGLTTSTAAVLSRQLVRRQPLPAAATIARIVAQRSYATPAGPPPPNFRLPRSKRWDDETETTLDRNGRYFLMTEMFRGMYVALEQYFRPPWVSYTLLRYGEIILIRFTTLDILFTILLKRLVTTPHQRLKLRDRPGMRCHARIVQMKDD